MERLTKIAEVDGKEVIACIYFGTEKCHIHSGDNGCSHCNVMGAILNKLYLIENEADKLLDDLK